MLLIYGHPPFPLYCIGSVHNLECLTGSIVHINRYIRTNLLLNTLLLIVR